MLILPSKAAAPGSPSILGVLGRRECRWIALDFLYTPMCPTSMSETGKVVK
jgi:hypothetical protein